MRIRSFIVAYALVLAILLFADRRPGSNREDHYSHVVDLTAAPIAHVPRASASESRTHIIAPGALIPGTWAAGQIPSDRLIAPLVVVDLNAPAIGNEAQLSLDDIAAWEGRHGMIPEGSVIAIRRTDAEPAASTDFPIAHDAAIFLIEGRSTIGFALDAPVDFSRDRTLAQQIALRGNYVVEGTAGFASLPATGSLIIVAPQKNKNPGSAPVRVLAMVR
jgi:kynurenine formamidase